MTFFFHLFFWCNNFIFLDYLHTFFCPFEVPLYIYIYRFLQPAVPGGDEPHGQWVLFRGPRGDISALEISRESRRARVFAAGQSMATQHPGWDGKALRGKGWETEHLLNLGILMDFLQLGQQSMAMTKRNRWRLEVMGLMVVNDHQCFFL